MECFLVEMWEDLRVKVGERDTFQSSGCFREGPSNSSIETGDTERGSEIKCCSKTLMEHTRKPGQFCCLRREMSRGSTCSSFLVSSMPGRAWPPPSSLHPSPNHKLPSQPAISLPTALERAPLSLSFLCPCSKLPSV